MRDANHPPTQADARAVAADNLDFSLDAAHHITQALRLILFDLEGEGLGRDARRAAAELVLTVEGKLQEVRESFDLIERYRPAGHATPPVKVGRA